jgi:outer membrane protein assembly factor BamB
MDHSCDAIRGDNSFIRRKFVNSGWRNPVSKNTVVVVFTVLGAGILLIYFRPNVSPPRQSAAAKKVEKLWEFDAGEGISAALALGDDGTLYAAGRDENVFALSPSGRPNWQFSAGPVLNAPTIGSDGAIYVNTTRCIVHALNRGGTERWRMDLGCVSANYTEAGSAIDANWLYTPARHGLCSVDLHYGGKRWETRVPFAQHGAPAILETGLIAFPGHGRMNTVDADGSPAWEYPSLSPEAIEKNGGWPPPGTEDFDSPIAVGPDKTIYGVTGDARVAALHQDGTLKWEFKTLANSHTSPIVAADGTIYFAGADGKVYALDPDGKVKWEFDFRGVLDPSPLLAEDGTLFVVTRGQFLAISPAGKLVWEFDYEGSVASSPTIAPDGTVYFATWEGKIYALPGGHGGLMRSSWPKYQHDLSNSGRVFLMRYFLFRQI